MRLTLHLAAVFVCSAISTLGACGQELAVAGLPGPVEWQNAPVDWKAGKAGTLTITAGKATDWFVSPIDGARRENSPRLVFPPADDFVLSARVTVGFRSQWDAGVLVLYVNDTTWAKLCFEMTVEKHPAIVSVVTQGLSDDNNSIPVAGNSVYLKIAKAGQAIFFYASEDGQDWKIIRAFSFGPGIKVRAGFSSQSPSGEGCTTQFDQINYLAKRVDLWTGK
jgi:regulation of enolase protein 1 (concanavalin A-like superfamily)